MNFSDVLYLSIKFELDRCTNNGNLLLGIHKRKHKYTHVHTHTHIHTHPHPHPHTGKNVFKGIRLVMHSSYKIMCCNNHNKLFSTLAKIVNGGICKQTETDILKI